MTDRLGTVIAGKYELLRVLGVGGMGAVYAARHTFTKRRVALKLLHGKGAKNESYGARLLAEARAASAIGHPSIVDVLDAGKTDDGAPYIVLELLTGADLDTCLYENSISTSEMVAIGIQILEALAAAHAQGIIHRDIKPDNVFLTRNDRGEARVKLLDFGLAKGMNAGAEGWKTVAGIVVGTPDYMSPEQARGDAVDARTDLWSTGVLLYRGLAGRTPFIEENYNRLMLQILTTDAPPLRKFRPDLPDAVLTVVDRALQRELPRRWQTAREMADALRRGNAEVSSPEWHLVTLPVQFPGGGSAHAGDVADAQTLIKDAATVIDPPVAGVATTLEQQPASTTPRRRSPRGMVAVAVLAAVLFALGIALIAMSHGGDSAAAATASRATTPVAPRPAPAPLAAPTPAISPVPAAAIVPDAPAAAEQIAKPPRAAARPRRRSRTSPARNYE